MSAESIRQELRERAKELGINEEDIVPANPDVLDGQDELYRNMELSEICFFCVRLHDDGSRTCDAYPDGIPRQIWMGERDHKTPFPGDHGLQFKSRTPQEDKAAEYISRKAQEY